MKGNKFVLRDYQKETIDRLVSNYNENKRRNLCVLATGSGKTVIATEFHETFKPKERTIFLVDRIELAYQTKESFQRSNPSLRVGIEMNTHHASKKDDVVIACVHTIGRKGSYRIGKFEPEDFTKIIVDEAHMAVSDTYVRTLNYLGVGPDNLLDDKMLVGLTATPNRTDGIGLGKIFDEIAVNFDIKYCIKNGWLTDIDIMQVSTNTDISGVKGTSKEFNLTELSKALNTKERNELIYNAYKKISGGEKAIVFASNVDHAHAIAQMFNEHDIPAFCIEANTDKQERRDAIKAYKAGKIKVLTNYGTLTTGFDAPETSTIILARPIKSELLLRQIIGRGLRPSSLAFIDMFSGAKDRKNMIDCSVKPTCKIVDMYDILGDHSIVSVPSLFGLNSELKIPKTQEKFFQEVVEPLEELEKEKQVDISKIRNLKDMDLIVKNQKLDVTSLETPEEIQDHTSRPWLPVGDDKYEIVYPKDGKTLIVQQNQLDKYEVIEYDKKDKLSRKLQDFYDLSAAIKLGDEYASQYFDTTWADQREEWETAGVSRKQMKFLIQLYKGGIRVSRMETYEDTGQPVLYYRKTGERLDAGKVDNLIKQRIGK